MSQDAKLLIGVGVVTAIIVIIAAFTIGSKPVKDQEQKVLSESQLKILLRGDTHMTGPQPAKVTVVEFGDFQCPACGSAYTIVKQIENDYKGKVNFAFREFPLNVHPNGPIAADAAEAAGGQGKFWEMYDKLYGNQKKWSDQKDPLEIFATYAKEIGINIDTFKADVKNKKYDAKIKADLSDGNQLGISATPTFFINGKMYTGYLPYDDFKSKIDSELSK